MTSLPSTVVVQSGDANTAITGAIVGRHIIVLYGGTLTADRAVLVHDTVGGPGQITVVHAGLGGFDVTVEYEIDPDNFELEATVAQGEEYVTAINDSGTLSKVRQGPITAGALAYLSLVGAAQLSPAAISGQPEITSLADGDYHCVLDETDGLLKKVRNEHVGGAGGAAPVPSVVTITGTTHLLTSAQRAHLNVLLLVDNSNQACVITVPDSAAAGDAWRVRSRTTNTITIQRQTNGTVNGGTSVAMTGTGKEAKIEVESNAGTAPVTTVEGETAEAATLDGDLNANGKEVYGNISPFQTATGSQAGAASGRSWKLTGNVTAVPVTNGWHAKYINVSGSNKTITPASGTCVVLEAGSTAASVTVANNKGVLVHGDGTNLVVEGDVV